MGRRRRSGERLLALVEDCMDHPALGGLQICDDWGFRTATFLSPAALRRFILPWHRKCVAAAHAAGKLAVLHGCGDVRNVMDDVLDMGYDEMLAAAGCVPEDTTGAPG